MTITKGPPTFNLGTIVRIHLINHFIYKLTLSSHYFSCHIYLLKSCYYLLIVIIRVFVEILPSSFLPLALKHAPYSFLCKFFLKWIIRGFLFGFVFGLQFKASLIIIPTLVLVWRSFFVIVVNHHSRFNIFLDSFIVYINFWMYHIHFYSSTFQTNHCDPLLGKIEL